MTETPSDLRSRRRVQLRAQVQAAAVRLFAERGFAATPVADLARAAGISERTYFRHFRTKEDAVLLDLEDLARRVRAVDVDGRAPARLLEQIEGIYAELAEAMDEDDAGTHREAQLLIARTPALREAATRRHREIMEDLRHRLVEAGVPDADLLGRLLAQIGTATLHAALDAWADQEGAASIAALYARSRALLRALT